MHRIITGDEKWIYYDNPKCPEAWLCLVKTLGGGRRLERRKERPIFRNFKITNIKIMKDELLVLFLNFFFHYSFANLMIFQIVKLIIFEFPNCNI